MYHKVLCHKYRVTKILPNCLGKSFWQINVYMIRVNRGLVALCIIISYSISRQRLLFVFVHVNICTALTYSRSRYWTAWYIKVHWRSNCLTCNS